MSDALIIETKINTEQPIFTHATIADFIPRCIVCTNEVPPRRRTSRNKETCSQECAKVLKDYKRWNLMRRFCPNCRHPSSPEERTDFLRWRKDRGMLRQKAGNPANIEKSLGRRKELATGLRRAIALLNDYAQPEITSEVRDELESLQKLIDGEGGIGRTLRPKVHPGE